MTNVPLANIQDEWSEFIESNANKKGNEDKNSRTQFLKELQKIEQDKSNESKLIQKISSINSDNHLNDQTDEEIEEEFSAFEQQFEQQFEQDSNQNKINKNLKVESLEELVNTFDEKIVNCFVDYSEPVELIAPVQILTHHEELINDCQMWLKLTENLNQILPVDWKNSYAMKFLLPYLIGNEKKMKSTNCLNSKDKLRDHFDTNSLDNSLDCNLDANLDDDQFVLSSFGYAYSTCNLQTVDNSLDNRTTNHFSSYLNQFESEYEEQLAHDLDFHSLILCSGENKDESNNDGRLLFTAEEVLKELDMILQEDDDYLDNEFNSTLDSKLDTKLDNSETILNANYNYSNYETDELDNEMAKENSTNQQTTTTNQINKLIKTASLLKPFTGHYTNSIGTSFSSNSLDDVLSSGQSLSRSQTSSSQISGGIENSTSFYPLTIKNQNEIEKQMFEQELRNLNITQLNEIYLDLERMIQNNSELLISELALKDELEYEKELKNQFISLLICIQNKRRKQNLNKKTNSKTAVTNENGSKYLTTVIPYDSSLGPPDARTLQVLIKILKAINDDSPTVPTLLTDFILKVVCPTS